MSSVVKYYKTNVSSNRTVIFIALVNRTYYAYIADRWVVVGHGYQPSFPHRATKFELSFNNVTRIEVQMKELVTDVID